MSLKEFEGKWIVRIKPGYNGDRSYMTDPVYVSEAMENHALVRPCWFGKVDAPRIMPADYCDPKDWECVSEKQI